jgi:putative endonuclease
MTGGVLVGEGNGPPVVGPLLAQRVYEHKNGLGSAFAKRYNVHRLVYYEVADNIHAAIAREKQIKGGSRQKKIDLINSLNPGWKDLFDEITK